MLFMERPLVSVIIPVYKTGESAKKLIEQLLRDQYKTIEIIVIDDGSPDDSLDILLSIKPTKRLKIIHQPNSGVSAARNRGILVSSGKYLLFIDSDDTVSPNFISELVKAIQTHNTILASTALRYNRPRQKPSKNIFTKPVTPYQQNETFKAFILRLLVTDGRLYAVINKIFISDIIKRHQIKFNEKLNFAEDTTFVLEYLKYATQKIPYNLAQIQFILKPLYHYNYGTATSLAGKSSLKWSNWQKSYTLLKSWVGKHPTKQEQLRLNKILLRWKVAHALAVARSDQPLTKKLQYVNLPKLIFAEIIKHVRR